MSAMSNSEAGMWRQYFDDMSAVIAIETAIDRETAESFAELYRDMARARLRFAFREAQRRQDQRIEDWLDGLDYRRSVQSQTNELLQALYSDPIEIAEYRRQRRKAFFQGAIDRL